MPGLIREDAIREIRERANITDVVSDVVAIKRRGRTVTGLCPFHSEKTPSFTVNEERGFYHCFGCGVGGDTINFVMEIDHLSFGEAVERLAGRAGVQLRYQEAGPAPARQTGVWISHTPVKTTPLGSIFMLPPAFGSQARKSAGRGRPRPGLPDPAR